MTNYDKPLISYVITAYNIEDYIAASIECAFKQTYEPLEIVLSDDCSTDDTFEIMKRLAGQYVGKHKIVLNRNERNLGITQHMNKAYMELANGEIIIAAHGDDISFAERTQKSYEFLSAHGGHTAVSFGILAMNEKDELLKHGNHNVIVENIRSYDLENPSQSGIPNIPAPSRAFYKYVMMEFGALMSSCPTEDELISFRSLLLGKNALLPEVMVYYRKHKQSSSNSGNFAKFPLQRIYEQQLEDMKLALKKQLITRKKFSEIDEVLKKGVIKRQLYRNYYAKRSFINLLKLLCSKDFKIREKGYYIKQHINYVRSPNIYY